METQRKLAVSRNPFERVVGSLVIAGQLSERLARLSDRSIGRLMFRYVWNGLQLASPEACICIEATRRLLRTRRRDGR